MSTSVSAAQIVSFMIKCVFYGVSWFYRSNR